MTHAHLVRRSAAAGTLRAHVRWQALHLHTRALCDFLRMRCGDVHLAEDLSQETLIRALGSGAAVEHLERPRTWLIHVARNVARDHRRYESSRPAAHLDQGAAAWLSSDEKAPGDQGPDVLLQVGEHLRERSWMVQSMLWVWRELSARDRQVLAARYFHGRTVAEISQVHGARASTVKVWLYRARNRLRAHLERFAGREEDRYEPARVEGAGLSCAEPGSGPWGLGMDR